MPIASGQGHDAAISIRQRDAVLWGGRLKPGETVSRARRPARPPVRGASAPPTLEGAGALAEGDAVRLTGAGDPDLTAGPDGAEVLIWATASRTTVDRLSHWRSGCRSMDGSGTAMRRMLVWIAIVALSTSAATMRTGSTAGAVPAAPAVIPGTSTVTGEVRVDFGTFTAGINDLPVRLVDAATNTLVAKRRTTLEARYTFTTCPAGALALVQFLDTDHFWGTQ